MQQTVIIAIDGPAGSGKGTLAVRLAKHFSFAHLDTGKLYRAVGWDMLQKGHELDNETNALESVENLKAEHLSNPALRLEQAGIAASKISAIPAVRVALLDFQRRFAATSPGAVLDGRDIGTIVCPEAAIKLFVTASVEIRAERRLKELITAGYPAIWEEILRDMQLRDERDTNRSVAPLRPAEDAVLLDTSAMNAEETFQFALKVILDHHARH